MAAGRGDGTIREKGTPRWKSGKPISFLFCIARIGAVFFGSCGDNLARILTIGVKESAYTQLIVHSLDAWLPNFPSCWWFRWFMEISSIRSVKLRRNPWYNGNNAWHSTDFNSHRPGDSIADGSFLRRGKWTWFSSQPSWGFTSSWKDSPQNSFCLAWTASMAFWASFPWSRCPGVAAISCKALKFWSRLSTVAG